MTTTALVEAIWGDGDTAEVKKIIEKGAALEVRVDRSDYDIEQSCTALGWAVLTWCSPELIAALVAAGARRDAQIVVETTRETPLQFLRRMKGVFEEEGPDGALLGFQDEFWGRAPTAEWFQAVERILAS